MAVVVLVVFVAMDTFFTGYLLASYRRLERTVLTLGMVQRDVLKHDVAKVGDSGVDTDV